MYMYIYILCNITNRYTLILCDFLGLHTWLHGCVYFILCIYSYWIVVYGWLICMDVQVKDIGPYENGKPGHPANLELKKAPTD